MATLEAAKVLGMDEKIGSLEKGKWADLALYQHDPLANAQNFRTLQWVFKGGQKFPTGSLEFPQPFDLEYWIRQWEKTKFELKAWDEP
jgi:formylmethanofuran dehydrogenase subunit A